MNDRRPRAKSRIECRSEHASEQQRCGEQVEEPDKCEEDGRCEAAQGPSILSKVSMKITNPPSCMYSFSSERLLAGIEKKEGKNQNTQRLHINPRT
jgi:hypothetical protein